MDNMIFGKRLKMARNREGFSYRDLSLKLNSAVSHTALSKYEKGEMLPSSNILILLSKSLNVSIDYFFRKITPLQLFANFRKNSSLSKKDQNRIIETTKNLVENYIEASEAAGFDFLFNLPKYNVSSIDEALKAAKSIREVLNIGYSPIIDLVSELEEASIVVAEVSEDSSFSGVCLSGENVAAIAINKNSDNVRKRFTLAHELGHLIMDLDNITDSKKEKLCHAFAGAFLIPPNELKKHIGKKRESLYIEELISIKEIFGISLQALAYQLSINGIISSRKHSEFKRYIADNNWKIDEPGNFIGSEQPKLLRQLVLRGLSKENLSISKASELIGVNRQELLKMEVVF